MRASQIRAAIVAAVEGITPDKKASHRDVFRELKTGYRELSQGQRTAHDRLFALRISTPPGRSRTMITTDLFECEFDLSIFYSDAPGDLVEDRLTKDCERIAQRLESLPAEQDDLAKIEVMPGSIDEMDGVISSNYVLSTTYRLTGV